jgi:hypothetical protein
MCLYLEVCNLTGFHGLNILESNPITVTCSWKTFIQSFKQFNENLVIYGERERILLRLEAIRFELRYLALAA